jgi:hypothetical protein
VLDGRLAKRAKRGRHDFDRINAVYVDKLDGVVETAFFEQMSNQWREEQNG